MLRNRNFSKGFFWGATVIVLVILISKLEWKIRNHDSTTFKVVFIQWLYTIFKITNFSPLFIISVMYLRDDNVALRDRACQEHTLVGMFSASISILCSKFHVLSIGQQIWRNAHVGQMGFKLFSFWSLTIIIPIGKLEPSTVGWMGKLCHITTWREKDIIMLHKCALSPNSHS